MSDKCQEKLDDIPLIPKAACRCLRPIHYDRTPQDWVVTDGPIRVPNLLPGCAFNGPCRYKRFLTPGETARYVEPFCLGWTAVFVQTMQDHQPTPKQQLRVNTLNAWFYKRVLTSWPQPPRVRLPITFIPTGSLH